MGVTHSFEPSIWNETDFTSWVGLRHILRSQTLGTKLGNHGKSEQTMLSSGSLSQAKKMKSEEGLQLLLTALAERQMSQRATTENPWLQYSSHHTTLKKVAAHQQSLVHNTVLAIFKKQTKPSTFPHPQGDAWYLGLSWCPSSCPAPSHTRDLLLLLAPSFLSFL